MDMKVTGVIIVLFIGIVFALAMLGTIAQQTGEMTTKQTVVNEEFNTNTTGSWNATAQGRTINESYKYTLSRYPEGWETTDCPITDFTLRNQTASYTSGTDYQLTASTGQFNFLNTSTVVLATNNNTYVNYTYCMSGYISDAGGRATANLILVFTVLAILLFAVWAVYRILF